MSAIESDDRGLLLFCPQCGQRSRMIYERLGQTFRCYKCHAPLPPPSQPIEIKNEYAFESLTLHSALPVLVYFWTPWCGPCKMVTPEIVKLAAEVAGVWIVAKLNTDELPGVPSRFGVTAIPTIVLFKGRLELARESGAMSAAAIRHFLQGQVSGRKR